MHSAACIQPVAGSRSSSGMQTDSLRGQTGFLDSGNRWISALAFVLYHQSLNHNQSLNHSIITNHSITQSNILRTPKIEQKRINLRIKYLLSDQFQTIQNNTTLDCINNKKGVLGWDRFYYNLL